MLHRLEIANFHSIREPQVIDLRAVVDVSAGSDVLAPLWPGAEELAPKVVALFGANASGKSNVLKALSFLAWFLTHSFRASPDGQLPYEPFRSDDGRAAPTCLVAWFAGPADPNDAAGAPLCRYAYELVLQEPPYPARRRVIREVLRYWPRGAGRSLLLFERGAGPALKAAPAFGLAGFRPALIKVLRESASALDTLAQLQHPLAQRLREQATAVISNIFVYRHQWSFADLAVPYVTHPHLLAQFNREIGRLSLGIRRMELPDADQNPTLYFHHHGPNETFASELESHGTLQFVHLFPMLALALERGGIAVIDELDSALHPTILAEVVRWFRDPVRNPRHAQLWMTCQNPALLEDLAKEEVFFCEKDTQGRTSVYGLRDIRGVKRRDDHARRYLGGVYGAVPHVG